MALFPWPNIENWDKTVSKSKQQIRNNQVCHRNWYLLLQSCCQQFLQHLVLLSRRVCLVFPKRVAGHLWTGLSGPSPSYCQVKSVRIVTLVHVEGARMCILSHSCVTQNVHIVKLIGKSLWATSNPPPPVQVHIRHTDSLWDLFSKPSVVFWFSESDKI